MSNAQQFLMFIGIMSCIILIFCTFIYLLMKLYMFVVKSTIKNSKLTDERLTKMYNNMKVSKDNKSKIIILAIVTGIFCGGVFGGIFYYFLYKKIFSNTYELYKQGMIERNLPL